MVQRGMGVLKGMGLELFSAKLVSVVCGSRLIRSFRSIQMIPSSLEIVKRKSGVGVENKLDLAEIEQKAHSNDAGWWRIWSWRPSHG